MRKSKLRFCMRKIGMEKRTRTWTLCFSHLPKKELGGGSIRRLVRVANNECGWEKDQHVESRAEG